MAVNGERIRKVLFFYGTRQIPVQLCYLFVCLFFANGMCSTIILLTEELQHSQFADVSSRMNEINFLVLFSFFFFSSFSWLWITIYAIVTRQGMQQIENSKIIAYVTNDQNLWNVAHWKHFWIYCRSFRFLLICSCLKNVTSHWNVIIRIWINSIERLIKQSV